MDTLLDLFHRLRDVKGLVAWGGYVGLTGIIFAETGLLVGFFLPGDSLLFATGALCATGALSAPLAFGLLTVAAIAGDAVNYTIGRFAGPKIFHASDQSGWSHRLLNRSHL